MVKTTNALNFLADHFCNVLQPSWWDEYDSGLYSSQSSPHKELPVSSGIPDSNGTPAASPRYAAANGSSHSNAAANSPKSQHAQPATSLSQAVQTLAAPGHWASPMQPGSKHPPPRYEHAANLVGHHLYIIGGNCGELVTLYTCLVRSCCCDICMPSHCVICMSQGCHEAPVSLDTT